MYQSNIVTFIQLVCVHGCVYMGQSLVITGAAGALLVRHESRLTRTQESAWSVLTVTISTQTWALRTLVDICQK